MAKTHGKLVVAMPYGNVESQGLPNCHSPGRCFAANELKSMRAYVVLNYDIKFEQQGFRPPNKLFGLAIVPDPSARVLFRQRCVVSEIL